jgi:hypothetical protein
VNITEKKLKNGAQEKSKHAVQWGGSKRNDLNLNP